MSLLTDRVSILDEFFRLVNADSSDADMIEHDTSGDLKGAYEALDVGLNRAQLYLINIGQGDTWLKTSSALTITGSDPDRYSSLPSDFLRLDADPDQNRSGIRYTNGVTWGTEILPADRNRIWGRYYWVTWSAENEEARIRYSRAASPPSTLVADYFYALGTLADATTVEMRPDDRNLIPAFAAEYAMRQSWFSGGPEQRDQITLNLKSTKHEAFTRARLSRRARRVATARATGRWIV